MHQESEELVCRPARQDLALEAKAPSETIVLKATISFTLSNTLVAVTAPLPPPSPSTLHVFCRLVVPLHFTPAYKHVIPILILLFLLQRKQD